MTTQSWQRQYGKDQQGTNYSGGTLNGISPYWTYTLSSISSVLVPVLVSRVGDDLGNTYHSQYQPIDATAEIISLDHYGSKRWSISWSGYGLGWPWNLSLSNDSSTLYAVAYDRAYSFETTAPVSANGNYVGFEYVWNNPIWVDPAGGLYAYSDWTFTGMNYCGSYLRKFGLNSGVGTTYWSYFITGPYALISPPFSSPWAAKSSMVFNPSLCSDGNQYYEMYFASNESVSHEAFPGSIRYKNYLKKFKAYTNNALTISPIGSVTFEDDDLVGWTTPPNNASMGLAYSETYDQVYVTTTTGVQAYDTTLANTASYTGDLPTTGPALLDNTLYYISNTVNGCYLVALNVPSLTLKWKINSVMTVSHDPVVYTKNGNKWIVLAGAQGSVLFEDLGGFATWMASYDKPASGAASEQPIMSKDRFFINNNADIYALGTSQGDLFRDAVNGAPDCSMPSGCVTAVPIVRGTFNVYMTGMAPSAFATVFTDNYYGVLTSIYTPLATGTVDYNSGCWTLNLSPSTVTDCYLTISHQAIVSPSANFAVLPDQTFYVFQSGGFIDTSTSIIYPITGWTWDFGDGNSSTTQHPVHKYGNTGTYTVGLTVCNVISCASVSKDVDITWPLNEYIHFTEIPTPSEATKQNKYPFTVTVSMICAQDGGHNVQLYSQYSRSRPYQDPQSKWGHLLPQWRFTDLSGNVIESVNTTDTAVYVSSIYVGVTGEAQFYYIDDMPTLEGNPVLLWGTLETSGIPVSYDNEKQELPGYANSKLIAVTPYGINGENPVKLDITRNGKAPILSPKWINVEFPFVISLKGDITTVCDGDEITIFDYPSSNNVTWPIQREISGVSNTNVHWVPTTTYFQQTDANGFNIGGFARNSVYSHVSALDTNISAAVVAQHTGWFRDTPFVWVSNPDNRTINRIEYPSPLPYYAVSSLLFPAVTALTNIYPVPYVSSLYDAMSLSGYGGIFGIAVDPCYDVWCTESELDRLLKYNNRGTLLSSINLKQIPAITALNPSMSASDYALTPVGIALDRSAGMWVTLFDSVSTLKFDKYGNFLFAVVPSGGNILIPDTDNSIKPSQVDTDIQNYAWVTYTSDVSSILAKYDLSGNLVIQIDQSPDYMSPVDIIVGRDNSFWVSNTYSYQLSGSIQHYTSAGALLATWDLSSGWPTYLTLDRDGRPWFTYGYYNVGYIDPVSGMIGFVVSGGNIDLGSLWFDASTRLDEQIHEGIACDAKNRIWVINSIENMVYVISSGQNVFNEAAFVSFKIWPDDQISWYNDNNTSTQYTLTSEWYKCAQAYGDWTGYRWINKYNPYNPNITMTVTLTGISNDFDIKPFINEYDIRRFNESWDATTQIRSYALPEHIYNNYNFWVNYIGHAIGGLETDQQVGRLSYEKIANFVKNHGDVDTANIRQLYSLANEVDVPIDDFNFVYPVNLGRIMDIISVDHQKLWGAHCKCDQNFYTSYICPKCGHSHASNLGDTLDVYTYMVTADTRFVVKPKFGTNYTLITPTVYNSLTTYPASAAANLTWLPSADYISYNFYAHMPSACNVQVDGVINWSDGYTTLSEGSSSLSAWYEDFQIVEEMLNYTLHAGLDMQRD